MAEADAQIQEAAKAELARRTAEVHDYLMVLIKGNPDADPPVKPDPAALLMTIPDLFGASLVEMIATGVMVGLQRATEAALQEQARQQEAAQQTASPLLRVQGTGNVHQAAQAAMTGMPPPPPGG
jgi:hypothetical protein